MSARKAEITLLKAITGIENDAASEERMNIDDFETKQLAKAVVSEMTRNAERAGSDAFSGLACFYCGTSSLEAQLVRCGCPFPEHFGCGLRGRRICADCERAHKAVAAHLEKLFSAPPVARVNARRYQRWRELRGAVRGLYDENADPTTCPLFVEIAQADEFDSDTDRFRREVLQSFRKARFIDYRTLAKTLKDQETETLLRAVVRSGLCR